MKVELERENYIETVISRFKMFVNPDLYNIDRVEDIARLSIAGVSIDGIKSGDIASPNELAEELAGIVVDMYWLFKN